MRSTASHLLRITTGCAAGAGMLAYAAYRRDIDAVRSRIENEREVIDSPHGPIEFGEAGDGPAVLVVHGAGGGFDQGLDLGRAFLGDGYRVVAPSRFGYLGTPVPADASPEAQADAHLRLLDALQLDRVPVIGVSAGGPSALQLCLKHPERCSALVLIVPMALTAHRVADERLSPMFLPVLNAVASSDFLFWIAMKVARTTLVKTILGTPAPVYLHASREERKAVDQVLRSILPISRRIEGIANDSDVSSNLQAHALDEMRVPTLIISAADDLYDTYDCGVYTAERVHDGDFVGFAHGGHLLLGHETEVRSQVTTFLKPHLGMRARMTMAV